MAIKGDASDIDAKVAFMRIKKPPHAAGAQTVDKKLNPACSGGQSAMICYPARGERACLRQMGENHLAAAAVGMRCTVRQTAVSSRQSIGNCITFFMMRIGRSAACDGP